MIKEGFFSFKTNVSPITSRSLRGGERFIKDYANRNNTLIVTFYEKFFAIALIEHNIRKDS